MAILFALLSERRNFFMEVSRATLTNHCSMFHERSNFAFTLPMSLTRYQPKRISFKQLQSNCVAVGMFCVIFSTVFCWHLSIQYFLHANILAGIVYNNQFIYRYFRIQNQITTCFSRFFSNHMFRSAFFHSRIYTNSSHCFSYCVHIIACQCTLYFSICLCVCQ